MNADANPDPEQFQDPLSDYEPTQYETDLHHALAEATVVDVPCKPFLSIEPTTTVRDAIRIMSGEKSASLLVVDQERVIGIFTERDVLERVAEQYDKHADCPVSEVMTTDPTVVYETDPAAAAVASIAVAGHRHVPVLSVDGKVTGVIGPRRVFEFMERHLDA